MDLVKNLAQKKTIGLGFLVQTLMAIYGIMQSFRTLSEYGMPFQGWILIDVINIVGLAIIAFTFMKEKDEKLMLVGIGIVAFYKILILVILGFSVSNLINVILTVALLFMAILAVKPNLINGMDELKKKGLLIGTIIGLGFLGATILNALVILAMGYYTIASIIAFLFGQFIGLLITFISLTTLSFYLGVKISEDNEYVEVNEVEEINE